MPELPSRNRKTILKQKNYRKKGQKSNSKK